MSTVPSLSLLMILRVAFLSCNIIVLLAVESTDALLFLQQQKNNNESSSRNIKAHSSTSSPIVDATDNDTITTPSRQRRRFFCQSSLLGVISASLIRTSTNDNPAAVVHAIGEGEERMVFKQKPTAPLSALVPAIQQRLLLEVATDACKKKDWNKVEMIIPKLNDDSDEDDNNDRYKYSLIGATTSRKMDAKVLKKYDPGLILRGDLTRAAMNLYQTNLNYNNILSSNNNNPNDVITITDTNWKKSYIRANDGLRPDLVTKVIGADIEIRQLLRNTVQEKLDDASAELYYVLNNNAHTNNNNNNNNSGSSGDDDDGDEVLNLLTEAAIQFDKWLDRVRYGDVREAIEIVATI